MALPGAGEAGGPEAGGGWYWRGAACWPAGENPLCPNESFPSFQGSSQPLLSILRRCQVKEVHGGEVVCEAKNNALLDGLLTVFHQERSTDGLSNVQVCSLGRGPVLGQLRGWGGASVNCGVQHSQPISRERCPHAAAPPCGSLRPASQNDLPVLTEFDKHAIATLCK